jgi:hypothetical protein
MHQPSLSSHLGGDRIKIDAVSVDVEIQCRHEVVRMRMDQFPQWVLRQINSSSVERFGATPAVASLLPEKKTRIGAPTAARDDK